MNSKKNYILKSFSLALIAGFLISCGSSPSMVSSSSPSSSRQPQASQPQSQSQSQSQSSEAQRRQDIYMQHLRNEGYAPRIDEDGDIAFRREGLNYYVINKSRDPSFTIILLPSIYSINSDSDREKAAAAVSYANGMTKVAKTYLTGQNDQIVSIAVEIYLENPNDFAALFSRFMGAITTARDHFRSRM